MELFFVILLILTLAITTIIVYLKHRSGVSSNINSHNKKIYSNKILFTYKFDNQNIDKLVGFHGIKNFSSNRLYCISTNSGIYRNEKWVNGKIAVLNEKGISFKKELIRPNDCAISNNGIVACCDWLNAEELTGKFYVFDQNGIELFQLRTLANIGSCSISDNGEVAIFETHNSSSKDGNRIFIIDIDNGSLLNKVKRPFNINKSFINTEKRIIDLLDKNEVTYKIDFNGNHLNSNEYKKQLLEKGSYNDILLYYSKIPDHIKFKDENYLNTLKMASEDESTYVSLRSEKIYRKIGEFYEASKNIDKTIEYWEKAMEINPRVGIKRKLEKYKKL